MTLQGHGRSHPVEIQVPVSPSAQRANGAQVTAKTIAQAVASALKSLGNLVQSGGGGFGKRLGTEFPMTLFLAALASILLGSVLSTTRLARQESSSQQTIES